MKNEVQRGGLWCHEVLQLLDDWVDESLPNEVAEQIAHHVAACDRCARFGGRYARLVATLRTPDEDMPGSSHGVVEHLLSGVTLPEQSEPPPRE